MASEERIGYIGTWIDPPSPKGKKERKALALCPDGKYREVVVRSKHDDLSFLQVLRAEFEEINEEKQELEIIAGDLKLVLGNLVFTPDDGRWVQGRAPAKEAA